MNRQDIEHMWKVASNNPNHDSNWFDPTVIKFAELVASAEREKYEAIITNMTKLLEAQQNREGVAVDMIAAGIAAEREACAKVCDDAPEPDGADLAARIRARGQA